MHVEDYVFVPKGDVYITRHCRDITNQSGFPLYVVFHQTTHEKLGLDCPEWIFEAVTADAAASAEKRQRAVVAKDQRERREAQAVLEQVFPHMPSASQTAILDHGFEKGSGRVGRVQKLDEVVKANLAVNAHIRHNLTAYDALYASTKAADPTQDVKSHVRMLVYDQVKRIADSWRTGILKAETKKTRKTKRNMINTQDQPATMITSVSNQGITQQDADATMDDLIDEAENLSLAETQALLKPSTSTDSSRPTTRSMSKALGPNHQKMYGGVRKSRKVPEQSIRVPPQRAVATLDTLDKALASMGLDEATANENQSPVKFKLPLADRRQIRNDQAHEDLSQWRATNISLPANRIHHILKLEDGNLTIVEHAELSALRSKLLVVRRDERKAKRERRAARGKS